jgi:7-keto-8-aminopelargonate synthetase-like enzyme
VRYLPDFNSFADHVQSSHNSMVVGARAARPAMLMKFKHNDFADLENQIKSISVSHDRLIVAIEGLYGYRQMNLFWLDGC